MQFLKQKKQLINYKIMAVNKVFLCGFIGKTPEIKTLEGGAKVATFSLATTDKGYTTKDGKVIEDKTEWHDIVAWNHNASFAAFAKKGDKVTIIGKLRTQKWEKDGVTHYKTSVVVDELELPQRTENGVQNNSAPADPAPITNDNAPSDDLPF